MPPAARWSARTTTSCEGGARPEPPREVRGRSDSSGNVLLQASAIADVHGRRGTQMETEPSSTASVDSKSERLQQVDLRATARRLLILEIIEAMPPGEISAIVVLREAYARGIYIPLPSLYRIIREFKRRGVLRQAREE